VMITTDPDKQLLIRNVESCLFRGSVNAFFKHSLGFVKRFNLVFDSFITSRVRSFRSEGCNQRWGHCVLFHRNTNLCTSFMKGGRLIQVYRHWNVQDCRQYNAISGYNARIRSRNLKNLNASIFPFCIFSYNSKPPYEWNNIYHLTGLIS
jgi:hypothetical protein